eukprot:3144992-Rhodomonas_salina.1
MAGAIVTGMTDSVVTGMTGGVVTSQVERRLEQCRKKQWRDGWLQVRLHLRCFWCRLWRQY